MESLSQSSFVDLLDPVLSGCSSKIYDFWQKICIVSETDCEDLKKQALASEIIKIRYETMVHLNSTIEMMNLNDAKNLKGLLIYGGSLWASIAAAGYSAIFSEKKQEAIATTAKILSETKFLTNFEKLNRRCLTLVVYLCQIDDLINKIGSLLTGGITVQQKRKRFINFTQDNNKNYPSGVQLTFVDVSNKPIDDELDADVRN